MPEQFRRSRFPILLGAFLSSWFAVALLDALLSGQKSFLRQLFAPHPNEFATRTLAALLVAFFAGRAVAAQRRAEAAEELKRRAEDGFEALLEGSDQPMCVVCGRTSRIEAANTLFETRLASASPSVGRPVAEAFTDFALREAAVALVGEGTPSPAHRKVDKAEATAACEMRSFPLGGADDARSRILLALRDRSLEKRCEELIEAGKHPHRTLLDSFPSPAALTLPDGTFQMVNGPFTELVGYPNEELEGKLALIDLVPPLMREDFLGQWERCCEDPQGASGAPFEARIRDRQGAERVLLGYCSALAGSKETVMTVCDVTIQRQTEDDLRASKTTLDLVQRISRMGNWEWDITTDTLTWSEEMYRIFWVDPREFTPSYEGYLNAVHPEDKETVIQAVNNALYKKKPLGLDHRIVGPDGAIRTIAARAEVTFDAEGRPLRMVGTNQDITWRIEAEQALRNSEEKFSKAFHASPDSIVITRADDGTYIDVNEAFQEMTGYSREEVLGKSSYADLKLWVDPDARMMMLKLMNQYGHVRNLEVRFRVKSGEIKELLWSADVIEYGGEACLIAISRDVTEQRHLEQELLKSEAKLYMKHEELKNLFQQMEGIRREWEETMDCISDQFILSDQWGRIRRFNRAVEEFSKKAHRDIVGKECIAFLEELGLKQHVEAPGVELFHERSGRWFVLKRYAFPSTEIDGTTREVVIINDTTDIGHRGEQPGQVAQHGRTYF